MGLILKRIAIAFLIIIGMLAASGGVVYILEYIGVDQGSVGIFALVATVVAVLFAVVSLFNERVRNMAAGVLLFLLGLPFGLAPFIYIYFKIAGLPISDLEEYTFVSQLIIVFLITGIGLSLMIKGAELFQRARKGQGSATP